MPQKLGTNNRSKSVVDHRQGSDMRTEFATTCGRTQRDAGDGIDNDNNGYVDDFSA